MPKDNKQKIKLLYLMEILRQDTDEQHPISTNQICKRLAEQGISCERRTVGMDMKVLNEYGYEIMSKMVGHEKAYYIDDRSFSVPEIKILMDAVQAAKFITPGKSAALIEKLAALGGSHQAEILKSNIVYKPRSEDEIVKIPESYSRIDISKLKDAPLPEGAEGYTIATGNASGIVFCYPVTAEASMPLDDSQKIIDFLHETMDENQGII